ncbi:flagellar motor switch protein FliN [Kaarinaea lacus]
MSDKRSDAKTIDDEWAAILGDTHPDFSDAPRQGRLEDTDHYAETDDTTGQNVEKACLDVILDIPVTLSLEVGKSKISIRDLLKLNQGSVVELDRLAGEPLDVLVNGTLVAHGEVVVTNDKYGIRLTDVISAAERIQKLR